MAFLRDQLNQVRGRFGAPEVQMQAEIPRMDYARNATAFRVVIGTGKVEVRDSLDMAHATVLFDDGDAEGRRIAIERAYDKLEVLSVDLAVRSRWSPA